MSDEARAAWLPRHIQFWPERRLVLSLTLIALVIRLYLTFTSFCITSDGMEYLRMARDFAAGEPARAFGSVFSPLYPWLISIAGRLIPNYELAADLISALLGTLSVPVIYWLTREVFERRDLAAGAAMLAAIQPSMCAYSASVMTDAGYVTLMLAAVTALIAGVRRQRYSLLAAAGLVAGIAYWYRAEAIGLILAAGVFLPAASLWYRRWSLKTSVLMAVLFAAVFLAVASPYLVYLRQATGRWTASREINVAASASVMELNSDREAWRKLAASGNPSLLAPLFTNPRDYLKKVAYDVTMSFYYFAEASEPLPFALLLIGLWWRGRELWRDWREALLAALTAFYFLGFAFFNTGPRFMLHLIPYTFGWVILGLEALTAAVLRVRNAGWKFLPPQSVAAALVLSLLPVALWPLGYDIRGLRYAGYDLAAREPRPRVLIGCDARAAFYAGARFAELTRVPPQADVCRWLRQQPGVNYLMASQRDERRWTNLEQRPCLRLLKRYPRTGDRYYDLFEVLAAAPDGPGSPG